MSVLITRLVAFIMLMLAFAQAHALSITHVSHMPSYVDSKSKAKVSIRFALDEAATVSLRVYDDRELLIKEITSAGLSKGDNAIIWDGTDSSGKQVPPEAYHYTLVANQGSEFVVYDTSDITGNDVISVSNLKWDKKAGTINYSVRKNTRVSLRVGMKAGGPLLTTVLDWQPRARGQYQEKWNGLDSSGTLDIKKLEKVQVFGQAYALSTNTIIIGPNQNASRYSENIHPDSNRRERTTSSKKMFNFHGKDAASRGDFNIDVDLPKDIKQNKNKLPVLTGNVPIRISIPKKDLIRMQTDRFEPMLFVDGIYVSELESGFFPLTWRLNAKDYKEGEHFITINVRGYEGQIGSTSRKVIIKH